MDLLLTHGYYLEEDPLEREVMRPYPPLGLLYLSAHLKRRGFEVEVFDTTFSSFEDLVALLHRRRPPVVGISGNLMTRRNVVRTVRACRELGARVVLGGPEPASYAAEYLERGADVVVEGEGELTLEQLLPLLLEGERTALEEVAGIHLLDPQGEVVFTGRRKVIADLDQQPFPDRAAIDLGRYLDVWRSHHGQSSVSLITARGCPFRCRWCSHGVYGYSHRRRSAANVADEIEEITATYDPDLLWYADDVFTIHRRGFLELAAELERRGIRLPFETISREDRLDEEVIETLATMGCFRLWIGAESGSQTVLDRMERRTDAARTREMMRCLKSHSIEVGTFLMVGYEGETVADIGATIAHLKASLPERVLTTVSYPIKGTPYYQEVQDRLILPDSWEESTDRDLEIAGRRSKAFYRCAIRWLVGEVAATRARFARRYLSALLCWLNAKMGRLGVFLLSRSTSEAGR